MKIVLLLVVLLVFPCVYAELNLSVYLDDNLTVGQEYTKLFRIDNLAHVTGVKDCINATVNYNISDIKEDSFELKCLNKYKYANTGEVIFNNPGNYTVCGWINQTIACKEVCVYGESNNTENNTESIAEPEPKSYIEIKDLPSEAKFGDLIELELEIYKGDTRKYAVYIDSKIIKKTSVYLKGKYAEYELKIPLQIKPNCDRKIEGGEYKIEVEGLDDKIRKRIMISGFNKEMCQKEEVIINDTIVINKTKTKVIKEECPDDEKLFDIAKIKCSSDLLHGRVVYESSSWKAYKIVPVLIIAVLTLLCVVLLWKR